MILVFWNLVAPRELQQTTQQTGDLKVAPIASACGARQHVDEHSKSL
jgi:hypothetical protein